MGMVEGKVQAKGIENIYNKIVPEVSPNLRKEIVIQVLKALGHPMGKTKKRT
jgi:hypothetical protein